MAWANLKEDIEELFSDARYEGRWGERSGYSIPLRLPDPELPPAPETIAVVAKAALDQILSRKTKPRVRAHSSPAKPTTIEERRERRKRQRERETEKILAVRKLVNIIDPPPNKRTP